MGKLTGKVAVVTGASRGVGRGIALLLAQQGATVYVTGRSVEQGAFASLALWPDLTFGERTLHNLAANPDIGSPVEFPGRVVAALAGDPNVMERSGGPFIIAEVAQNYGITDVDGQTIPSLRAERGTPYWMAI